MRRRFFFKRSFQWLSLLSALPFISSGKALTSQSPMPKRSLGKTGQSLSIIGFGGIVVKDFPQPRANELVAKAWDAGVNYFDVAPTYGNAEEQLGPALKPYRKSAFLACKTQERDASGAERELNQSLKKLKTDYFDLYQLHALTSKEDVDKAFAEDGAIQTFMKAKREGKVRYLGFSAHSEYAALRAMELFEFDTILFPVNFVCWYQGDFGPKVVKRAQEMNMGILALKSMAFTRITDWNNKPYDRLWYIPIEDSRLSEHAVKFTLSKGVTAAIPPGDERFWWKAVDIVRNTENLNVTKQTLLKRKSKGVTPLFQT